MTVKLKTQIQSEREKKVPGCTILINGLLILRCSPKLNQKESEKRRERERVRKGFVEKQIGN
jgi:hypothetical protein